MADEYRLDEQTYLATQDARFAALGQEEYNRFNNEVYLTIEEMKANGVTMDPEEEYYQRNLLWMEYEKSTALVYQAASLASEKINNTDLPPMNFISGMPPQFNDMADPRLYDPDTQNFTTPVAFGDGIGRMYNKYIVNDIPLVFIKPGKPIFMPSVNIFDKAKIEKATIQKLWDQDDGLSLTSALDSSKTMTDILNEYDIGNDTRYYGFKPDYATYKQYVNTICRNVAINMGLHKYFNFDLDNPELGIGTNIMMRNSLAFFFDKESTSVSDSGSTSTGDSLLGSTTKSAGSVAREINFIFGEGEYKHRAGDAEEKYQEEMNNLMNTVGKDPTSFLNRIGSSFKTIFAGGNLLFPEIWQDSSYKKSYTIGFKFFSPYGDAESIFRYVYVPFFTILAMALPRQLTSQGYTSPFIIKASAKGFFNCDLGMIDSISFSKANNDDWSNDGFPLSINVNITISDLYPVLMMSTDRYVNVLRNNTGMMEFMNTMAGVGFNDFNPLTQLEAALSAHWARIGGIPYAVQNKINSFADNIMYKVNNFFFR